MAVTEEAVPESPAAKQPPGMLESLRVRSFRGFRDFSVESLGRINLFAGRNNSGKTALLEALSLLAGAGWPNLAFNPIVIRGAEVLTESATVPGLAMSGIGVRESLWKPMFHELDLGKSIEVKARHSALGALSLNVDFARQKNVKIKVGNLGSESIVSLQDTLGFVFSSDQLGKVTSQAFLDDQSLQRTVYTDDTESELSPSFPAVFLKWHGASPIQEARNLGEVRRQKRGDLVLRALRIIEPRIQNLEDNSASGIPMIWADIGLDELIPLAALGDGLGRAARIFTGMIHVAGGVLMVDEIENGFHHSTVSRIWKAIDEMSRDFSVQVFATTHSYECVESAYSALGDEGFMLHRIESRASGNRCVTYTPDALRGAVHHHLEVR